MRRRKFIVLAAVAPVAAAVPAPAVPMCVVRDPMLMEAMIAWHSRSTVEILVRWQDVGDFTAWTPA